MERKKGYWTFEGVAVHLKNGKVMRDDFEGFMLLQEGFEHLLVPRHNRESKRRVMEIVHDALYKITTIGDQISWVELLNIKEYDD